MATITNSTTKFPAKLVTEVFDKVKGHSALAVLSSQTPIPFSGQDVMVFTMDGEASIVGEGAAKPAGEADFTPKTIKPIKFVYQHRVTDEFINMSEENQLPYLSSFTEGFATKMARAVDISAFHGLNPADAKESDTIGTNCFDKAVTQTVTYNDAAVDDNIDDATALIIGSNGTVTGIALAPAAGSALGKMKASGAGTYLYPEFRFGANPGTFGGMSADVNDTISFGSSLDRAIVGDFAGAFRWGYSKDVPMEVIEYGDPDGQGDLKRNNQIVLRAEAYIGWGILDANSFAIVKASA